MYVLTVLDCRRGTFSGTKDEIFGTLLQVLRTSKATTNSERKTVTPGTSVQVSLYNLLKMTSIAEGQPVLSVDGAPAVSESFVPRRVGDADVRSIFDCLHHGQQPPRHLPFHIVPAGPGDLKLSPPSYEFPGAYSAVQTNSDSMDAVRVQQTFWHGSCVPLLTFLLSS